jgi:hypothetical protein
MLEPEIDVIPGKCHKLSEVSPVYQDDIVCGCRGKVATAQPCIGLCAVEVDIRAVVTIPHPALRNSISSILTKTTEPPPDVLASEEQKQTSLSYVLARMRGDENEIIQHMNAAKSVLENLGRHGYLPNVWPGGGSTRVRATPTLASSAFTTILL